MSDTILAIDLGRFKSVACVYSRRAVRRLNPVNANLRPAMDSISFLVAVGPHDAVVVAVAGDVAEVDV